MTPIAVHTAPQAPPTLFERASLLPVFLLLAVMDRGERTTAAVQRATTPKPERNDAIHIVIIIAIIVLLAIAASLVGAAIVLCSQRGGVLEFLVKLDPWTVKVGCKRI